MPTTTLTCQTAGESHGPALIVLVNGMPAGHEIDLDLINRELARRQGGYGRGARQKIERDVATFLSGTRAGVTLGSPIAMHIANRDSRLDDLTKTPPLHRPRPGHADLAGSLKWLTTDCRGTLERASARETAARVAAGALARGLLRRYGIEVFGFVRSVLDVETDISVTEESVRDGSLLSARDASEVYCPDPDATRRMIEVIRQAKIDKDTVGGIVETHVFGCPPGLGTCVNWSEKLDSRIGAAVLGIQAFKGVEIGLGFATTRRPGSRVHDPIAFDPAGQERPDLGFVRSSNNAGGIEGGMTNGQPVVVRGAMKPISTLLQGLPSIDLNTKAPDRSQYERSDVCAVSAASVVMENVIAFEIAAVFREKFGGDSITELDANYRSYRDLAQRLPLPGVRH